MDDDDLEGLRHLYFGETEGEKDIQEDSKTKGIHLLPLKTKKMNIRTKDNPKLESIIDYLDVEKTKEIFSLLQEYEDLFPSSVADLKGIKGDLGEMCIILKPDARPIKHRPYRLNPRVKENVKVEIDKMLKAGLIFPVEEAKWVSLIVIQSKKDKIEI